MATEILDSMTQLFVFQKFPLGFQWRDQLELLGSSLDLLARRASGGS